MDGDKKEMKKKILIAGFFVAIMLLVPATTATRTNLLATSKINDNIAPLPDGDPDGPTEGGLDDPSDWNYAGYVAFLLGIDMIMIQAMWEDYKEGGTTLWGIIKATGALSIYTAFVSYICLLEAFDVKDLDRDGC